MFFKKKQQHNPNIPGIPGNLILHLLLKYVAGLVGSALGHISAGGGYPFPSLHPEVTAPGSP